MSKLQYIKAFEDTISVTDFKKNPSKVYKKLKNDHEIVITKKQDVLGVLINRDTYEKKEQLISRLQERLEYYEIHSGLLESAKNNKTYTEKKMREQLNL